MALSVKLILLKTLRRVMLRQAQHERKNPRSSRARRGIVVIDPKAVRVRRSFSGAWIEPYFYKALRVRANKLLMPGELQWP